MTVKEILELPEEQQREYSLNHIVSKPHNLYELVDYLEESYKFTAVMGSIEQSQRLIGWYQGQASVYQHIIEILQDLGVKKK